MRIVLECVVTGDSRSSFHDDACLQRPQAEGKIGELVHESEELVAVEVFADQYWVEVVSQLLHDDAELVSRGRDAVLDAGYRLSTPSEGTPQVRFHPISYALFVCFAVSWFLFFFCFFVWWFGSSW